jgi:DNA polymerase I
MKKIAIIDVSSYIFRAYHALPPMTSPKGEPVNAIYGFISMYFKTMDRFKGFAVIAALDSGSKTFRKERYPEYKANRKEVPPELTAQFKHIELMLDALGVKKLVSPGFEADDIIAALVSKYDESEIVIVSSDKDLMQLADKRTILFDSMKNKIIGPPEVENKFGVDPSKMRDLLALMGDSSDNIPGVPGVGPKTGASLLNKYNSIEGIYENINEIKGSLKNKLIENKSQLMLSRELVTLRDDINLDFSDLSVWNGVNQELFFKFATELGFKSLIRKAGLEFFDLNEQNEVEEKEIGKWKEKEFELSGNEFFGLFLNGGFFIGSAGLYCSVSIEDVPEGKVIYSFNIKDYITYPFPEGIEFIDLQISYFCHDSGRHGYSIKDIADIIGYNIRNIENPEEMFPFIEALKEKVDKLNDKSELIRKIEMPNLEVIKGMEKTGIEIDLDELHLLKKEFDLKIKDLREQITVYAGMDINPNSPKQLGEVLFEKLQLPTGRKTKSGYSTNHDVLENLAAMDIHPLPGLIIQHREYTKLMSTYIEPIIEKTDNDGRLRTTFIVTHAATGRLASRDPNLQNIPVRTDEGRRIRGVFKAAEGMKLISLDYSQIELRILASLSKDKELLDAFNKGEDIHNLTACAIFNTLPFMVDENMRRQAKAVNFGIIYGMQAFKLSQDTGVDIAFAKQYIEKYFAFYPMVKKFLDDTVSNAAKNGFVETVMGRRRYIPELKHSNKNIARSGERMAINSVIQGSAADIIKIGTVAVHKLLKNKCPEASVLLQIHDELIIEIPEKEIDLVEDCSAAMIKAAGIIDVPVTVNHSSGDNWSELK